MKISKVFEKHEVFRKLENLRSPLLFSTVLLSLLAFWAFGIQNYSPPPFEVERDFSLGNKNTSQDNTVDFSVNESPRQSGSVKHFLRSDVKERFDQLVKTRFTTQGELRKKAGFSSVYYYPLQAYDSFKEESIPSIPSV